jgi:hypothetical protein
LLPINRLFAAGERFMRDLKETDKRAISLGVRVQLWYLVNLLLLPGIGFMMVVYCYWQFNRHHEAPFALRYAKAALVASLLGGSLIVLGCLLLWWVIADPQNTIPLIVVYFTMVHSIFILWGMLGIARAMAGKPMAPLGFDL